MPAWFTSLLRELIPEPIAPSLSTTITWRPARASARATASPRTPAPITRQSTKSTPRVHRLAFWSLSRLAAAFTQVEFTLFIELRGAAEFSFCAKRGKENPSLGEGKSKPGGRKIQATGRKIQALPSRESSLLKGLCQPRGHSFFFGGHGDITSRELRSYGCAIGARAPDRSPGVDGG